MDAIMSAIASLSAVSRRVSLAITEDNLKELDNKFHWQDNGELPPTTRIGNMTVILYRALLSVTVRID